MERISEETLDELIVWAACSNEAVHKAMVELKELRNQVIIPTENVTFSWLCTLCNIGNTFTWPIVDYEPWTPIALVCEHCGAKTFKTIQPERVR